MYPVDLSPNVQCYGDEVADTWGGAASVQMIRNGYPNPTDRLYCNQTDIWNAIQLNNSFNASADDLAAGWATNPTGLQLTLNNLNNPSGVNWSVVREANLDTVLGSICYWMDNVRFPCAVLINGGYNWVVVVSIITDDKPASETSLGALNTLRSITFNSPVYDGTPKGICTQTTVTGDHFVQDYYQPVQPTGTWNNEYVAVLEPPKENVKVIVKKMDRTGKKMLSPTQALESAERWIADMKLAEKRGYHLLGHKELKKLEPLLVRDEMSGQQEKAVPYYYIVPFGLKGEYAGSKEQTARVCVLVNAYSGQFEEVTAFCKAVRFLPKEEALNIVTAAMRLEQNTPADTEMTLMFQPSQITYLRSLPFWRVKIGKRIVYVDQNGFLFSNPVLAIPGS